MEQRHEEEFTSTVCVIEGSGSKGTVSAFHANTGRKENLGKYYVSLPVKTLTTMILRCTVRWSPGQIRIVRSSSLTQRCYKARLEESMSATATRR